MRIRPAAALTAAVAAALSLSVVAAAQNASQSQAQPAASSLQSGRTNRDLSGVWNASSGIYQFAAFSKDEPPMTAWGKAQYEMARPSQGSHGVKLSETNDKVYKCAPPGMPYIYIQLFPMQIVHTRKEVIEIFEYDHIVRHIYIDGRPHPAGLKPSYDGHSIGHWEGDTLVVDTIGLNGKNWLDRVGHPESAQMHILERIRRTEEKTLQVDLTFNDPRSYTRPWNARIGFLLHPDWEILEHVCEDNLAFENFEK